MGEEITVHKEQIEIIGARNMVIYTFDLDGNPMQEMRAEDIQDANAVKPQKGDG